MGEVSVGIKGEAQGSIVEVKGAGVQYAGGG